MGSHADRDQPAAQGLLLDRLAFQAWSERVCLSPEEEHERNAVCRLAQALDQIIREELSPAQRFVVERCWLEGERPAQLARELGQNRSTVSRTLHRAQESIYSRLKYAVLTLEEGGAEDAQDFMQAVSAASQVLAAGRQEGNTIGGRIQKLRLRHALTKKQLAAALSVDEAAVSRWERDVELPGTLIIMRIARMFSVRTDALLFGEGEALISPARPCKYALPAQNDPHPSA